MLQETVDDELLVEDRQLHRDAGQFGEVPGGRDVEILLVPVILVDKLIAMQPIQGEDDHHHEVRDQQSGVEGVPAVEMLKCPVAVVRAQVVLESALVRCQKQAQRIRLPQQRCKRGFCDSERQEHKCKQNRASALRICG